MKAVQHSQSVSLRTKLVMMCLLLLAIPSLIIGFQGYNSASAGLSELGSRILKNNVHLTIEMIEVLQKQVDAGKISIEDAQEQVKQHILGPKQADGTRTINPNIDSGASGYMFVLDEKRPQQSHSFHSLFHAHFPPPAGSVFRSCIRFVTL
ncbi:hypothetical protein BAG01nite_38180 [Brevibacillus agri]|uniref:Single Cache domain-containing protein n=1 Tax=Brevibacillus agri TaxID=51101 RepID=A0A3M8ATN1_9BACL|nr:MULTISPECIES: cache domain-containing protein [Brevibacillus]EJL44863.1 Tar ligand binding/Cache domain containing protein [Brevibacillus sp. CF112]MBY0050560.1 cache domain-containing protein [Brevibacillus agri]MCG5251945.1 cache domain-containing protein [Brevibacillus agri]MDN4095672.1 cache domain-containing protein [Brevibacillus agri]MDR9507623.1 cache domain-containing protein [Brevibacillus agri]